MMIYNYFREWVEGKSLFPTTFIIRNPGFSVFTVFSPQNGKNKGKTRLTLSENPTFSPVSP